MTYEKPTDEQFEQQVELIMESQGINDRDYARRVNRLAHLCAERILSPVVPIIQQECGDDKDLSMVVNLFTLLMLEANAGLGAAILHQAIPCQCDSCKAERAAAGVPDQVVRH